MKIAVASGKGGTGKTTVALALAESFGPETLLVDCDVEEPNCHLFSTAPVLSLRSVKIQVPAFDDSRCTGCGACVKACRFHALARLGSRILLFPELCHSCGGCQLACPESAIQETSEKIGTIEFRADARFQLLSGTMKIGHAMAPPVIRQLKSIADGHRHVIFDAPPGTACSFTTTVQGCDIALLVTEPTPFGLHDLKLAVDALKVMKLRHAVILNRSLPEGDELIDTYCRKNQIPLLLKIPFSREAAEGYSCGRSLLSTRPEWGEKFQHLRKQLEEIR